MRYKGTDKSIPAIAHELDAHFVVEGSIRRAGDQVRVVVQLVSPEPIRRSGRARWTGGSSAWLSSAYAVHVQNFAGDPALKESALASARRAVALEPDLGDAHRALETALTTAMGLMVFDIPGMEYYERVGRLEDLVLHEIAHVLGIGTEAWELNELLVGAGGRDPRFIGLHAQRAFRG